MGLDLLGAGQCEEIYLAVLKVLDRVGVNVFEPRRVLSTVPSEIPIGRRGTCDPSALIRSQWGIDMAFREDECRKRKDNAAENFATLDLTKNPVDMFGSKNYKNGLMSADSRFL